MPKDVQNSTMVETTLYDLISALSTEMGAGQEELVIPIVVDLLNSGRIKFVEGPRQYKVTCT